MAFKPSYCYYYKIIFYGKFAGCFEYNGVKYLLNVKGKTLVLDEGLIGYMRKSEIEAMNAARISREAMKRSESALTESTSILSNDLITRIKSGKFLEDEIQRLSDARRLLKDKNLPALTPEQEKELLLSHYRANEIENKFQRVCAKVRPLIKARLSKMSSKELKEMYKKAGGTGENDIIRFFTSDTPPTADDIIMPDVSGFKEAKFPIGTSVKIVK